MFASDQTGTAAYDIFLSSGVEAAAIASVLGGGLMLLLATFLSRRVERLSLGARAIEQDDFKSFNAMAARLENSVAQLEEQTMTLDVILNNLTEGVMATDLQANAVFANRSARAMLGVRSEASLEKVPDPWKDFDCRRP